VNGGVLSTGRDHAIPNTVNAKLVYPSSGQARAIVVVAHCSMCWGDWYPHLASLAEPYNVMLVFLHSSPVDAFLHGMDVSNGAGHTYFSGFAKDMATVLRNVRDASANDPESEIYGRLAPDAPALAMGHSLGGAGGLIAAGEVRGNPQSTAPFIRHLDRMQTTSGACSESTAKQSSSYE